MPQGFAIALCLMLGTSLLAASSQAFAQASPVSEGEIGTPITPDSLGNWNFMPGITASEAARDAQAQGFRSVSRLHQDDYGDWIGQCRKGELIVFPDGTAYPL